VRPVHPDTRRRLQNLQDLNQRGYLQWALIRTLAFGERDWMAISAILFLIDSKKEFLSIAGFSAFLMGLFFVGPVFGMILFFSQKAAMAVVKSQKRLEILPLPVMRRLTWAVNIFWFPIFFFVSYHAFGLFYEGYDSLFFWRAAKEG